MAIVINNETGLAEDLGSDLVDKALSQGTHGVPLITPEGETGNFSIDDARKLISQGYRQPEPKELEGLFKHAKYGTKAEQAKTFVEGALADATLGLSTGIETGLGISTPEDIRGRAEENPGVRTLGSIAGFAGSLMSGVGAAPKVVKAGETVAKALGFGLKGASTGSKVVGEAVNLAVQSAILGAGSELEKTFTRDPMQTVESAVAHVGLSALLGAGTGAVFGAIPPLLKAAGESPLSQMLSNIRKGAERDLTSTEGQVSMRPLLKKFISTFGGVSEENINEYLEKSDLINQVPGFEELHAKAYKHIENLAQDLNSKKITAAKMRSDLKAYEKEVRESFKQQGFDLAQATKKTKELSQMALAEMETELQTKAIDSAEGINEALKILKKDVRESSKRVSEELPDEGKGFSLEPVYQQAKKLSEELRAKGTLEDSARADKIIQYAENLITEFGDEVSPAQVKPFIKGLDDLSDYDRNVATFDKPLSIQYKSIRHSLKERLEQEFPEYKKGMESVAEKARALDELEDFGELEVSRRKIKGLKDEVNYKNEIPKLQKLENLTGKKFLDHIESYANPERRKELLHAIPELKDAAKMAEALEELKNPATQRLMQEQIELSELNKSYLSSEQDLAKAMAEKKELAGITEGTLHGKMNSVKQGRSPHGRIQLEGFPGLENIEALKDKTLPELLDLLSVQEAFEKTATQGSRKVNLYGAVLGSVLGTASGGFGGFLGGLGGGAALGGAMDLYGPKVTKKLLDSYLHKFGDLAKASGGENVKATQLALYKFLSAQDPMSEESFKSTVEMARAFLESEKKSAQAIDALFQGSKAVLPDHKANQVSHEKLKKRLEALTLDPSSLLNQGGGVNQDVSEVIGQMGARALSYLDSQRPSEDKLGVLDGKRIPSKTEEAAYTRVLSLADKPLSILNYVSQGNMTDKDIEVIKTIYPSFYQNIAQKIINQVIEKSSKGESIPYQRRVSLSKFLGMPLDSSMNMESLLATKKALGGEMAQEQVKGPGQIQKGSLKSLKHTQESMKSPLEQRLTKH